MPTDYLDPDDSSGLLGHFTGTVVGSVWSTPRAESNGKAKGPNADKLKEFWTVRVDEILQDDYDGADVPQVTVNWGVGTGWDVVGDDDFNIRHEDDPGDEAVESEKAKPIRIKGNSGLGKFLGLITGSRPNYNTEMGAPKVMDGGDEDVEYDLTGCAEYLRANDLTDSRDSRIWLGTQFEFRGLGQKWRNMDGEPWMTPLPTRFLGVDKDVAGGVIDGDYSPEPAVTLSAVDAADVAPLLPSDTPPATVEAVTALVNTSKTFNRFMKDALLLDDVAAGTPVGDAVMDETNGPWSARS